MVTQEDQRQNASPEMSRARRPPRVVIDTNLVLSALVFGGGRPAQLRHAWQAGSCQPLVCAETLKELARVLSYPKFKLTADEQQELLADYLPYCAAVKLPSAKPPAGIVCRDADDLPFLHLAVAGKAEALVSGDADLLVLAGQFVCPILTADEFINKFII